MDFSRTSQGKSSFRVFRGLGLLGVYIGILGFSGVLGFLEIRGFFEGLRLKETAAFPETPKKTLN